MSYRVYPLLRRDLIEYQISCGGRERRRSAALIGQEHMFQESASHRLEQNGRRDAKEIA